MKTERRNITQPADWWAAWKASADKQGASLSEWVGNQCNAALTNRAAKSLTDRKPAHRPKKTGCERKA
jgi:hypothetical protein